MKTAKVLFLFLPLISFAQNADEKLERNMVTIAFGSCSHQDKPDLQLWQEINSYRPDLWIWMGDIIYGDSDDMDIMREKYDLQKSHTDYQQLLRQTEVIGIWDDHDFGLNDGGKEYTAKEGSKLELFRFLDVDDNHPARIRDGAYQSYSFLSGDRNVKVILLDTRYFRDALNKDHIGWNIPNKKGEILGKGQWNWLQDQIRDTSIDLFIIVSGIQVLPKEHRFEKWSNFPKERNKLLKMISKLEKPVVLMSGDRHISEVSRMDLKGYGHPLYEFTSSSLTNPSSQSRQEENQYRIKEFIYQSNFAILTLDFQNDNLKLNVHYEGKNNQIFQMHQVHYKLK